VVFSTLIIASNRHKLALLTYGGGISDLQNYASNRGLPTCARGLLLRTACPSSPGPGRVISGVGDAEELGERGPGLEVP
jgi:hypothetical protein